MIGCLYAHPSLTWQVGQAQSLIVGAEASFKLCKPWLPTVGADRLSAQLNRTKQMLADAVAAAAPGQQELPALGRRGLQSCHQEVKPLPTCSGCGKTALQLRSCSACRAVAYCPKECQVKHWKQDGHKRECAALAAAAAEAGASSSG